MSEQLPIENDDSKPELTKNSAREYLLVRQHRIIDEIAELAQKLNSSDQSETIEGILNIAAEVGVESKIDDMTPKPPVQIVEEIKLKVNERIEELNS